MVTKKNELVETGKKELAQINKNEISSEVIKNYFCSNASDEELALGALICKKQGLDPFTGDVHFVKYGNSKMQVIVSKYAFLKRAERNKNYQGFKAWVEKVDGILTGKCEVYRKDRVVPIYCEAYFNEYKQNNTMWNTKPRTMIRKVAIVQALREAFADELGGLYTTDEMPDFDHDKYPNSIETSMKDTGVSTPTVEADVIESDIIEVETETQTPPVEEEAAPEKELTPLDLVERCNNVDGVYFLYEAWAAERKLTPKIEKAVTEKIIQFVKECNDFGLLGLLYDKVDENGGVTKAVEKAFVARADELKAAKN